MNRLENFLKYKYILLAIMILTIFSVFDIFNIKDGLQTNLYQGFKLVKVTEEKIKIDEKNLVISARMPEIHYSNEEVERYINSYIRRNINDSINHERQESQLYKNNSKTNVNINYHIVFENKSLLNIVIYKEIRYKDNKFKQEKDSYVFDLNTGQRIFLNNLLKDNEDYEDVIYDYIIDYIKDNKLKVDKNKIKINKYTNYEIIDEGINIYFNPYKSSKEDLAYEFKIPFTIFKNKIKMIQTSSIIANIDTQTITKNNKYINSIININDMFDGGIYSYQEHLIKPSYEIYNLVLNRFSLNKEETLFFDDKEKNVIVANGLGIKSFIFTSIIDIKNNL